MSVQEMKPIKEGKVREIYDNGDTLIMVATGQHSNEERNCIDTDVKILV